MRKILIIVLLFVVGLPSYTRNTKTFRQWGEESLKVIDTYLKSDKGTLLYCEKASSSTPAFVWPTSIQIKALIYAGRIEDAKKLVDNVNQYYYVSYMTPVIVERVGAVIMTIMLGWLRTCWTCMLLHRTVTI